MVSALVVFRDAATNGEADPEMLAQNHMAMTQNSTAAVGAGSTFGQAPSGPMASPVSSVKGGCGAPGMTAWTGDNLGDKL